MWTKIFVYVNKKVYSRGTKVFLASINPEVQSQSWCANLPPNLRANLKKMDLVNVKLKEKTVQNGSLLMVSILLFIFLTQKKENSMSLRKYGLN